MPLPNRRKRPGMIPQLMSTLGRQSQARQIPGRRMPASPRVQLRPAFRIPQTQTRGKITQPSQSNNRTRTGKSPDRVKQLKKVYKAGRRTGEQVMERISREATLRQIEGEAQIGIPLLKNRVHIDEVRRAIEETQTEFSFERFIDKIENPGLQRLLADDAYLHQFINSLPDNERNNLLHALRLLDGMPEFLEERRKFYQAIIVLNFLYYRKEKR